MATKNDALSLLQRHVGASNGVTAEQMALSLDIPKRHVRTLVTELREDGIAVCGHPRTGYFIAANDEEIRETCKFLRDRALTSLRLESVLSKTALPDLLGQLKLKT